MLCRIGCDLCVNFGLGIWWNKYEGLIFFRAFAEPGDVRGSLGRIRNFVHAGRPPMTPMSAEKCSLLND